MQKLADEKALSAHLPSFCQSAHLFCFPDSADSLAQRGPESHFAIYSNRNFTNYGSGRLTGTDSFKNYSDSINIPTDSFKRYSRGSVAHSEKFSNYAPDGNVVGGSFSSYGAGAKGGSGEFTNYDHAVNVPNLHFTSYDSDGNGRPQTFTSYSDEANSGNQGFKSYASKGNGVQNTFASYGKDSNVLGSTFASYSQGSSGAVDNFTSYGFNGNSPENNFRSYADAGNGATETFTSYRDRANVGDDSFISYAKNTNTKVNFANYGKTVNEGTDTFKGYGKGTGFMIYGVNNTFIDYPKTGIQFAKYTKQPMEVEQNKMTQKGISTRKWVEPGKFFREAMLKQGTVMPMPDIRDKMPSRSFLPRQLAAKLPFSTKQITELKEIFHGNEENPSMGTILESTLSECERVPSKGETKKCVASIEDMIDLVVSILGRNITVKSTENVGGSKGEIEIGKVVGLNGGKVTKSVSCHQSLFPYLVYFCHSVPKVRVYQAEILEVKKKESINRGTAICHLDTSVWSEGHGAFVALGGRPGEIEVCHWIFENDMTWVTAD